MYDFKVALKNWINSIGLNSIYFSTINQQFTTILRFFVVLLCHPASGSAWNTTD